MFDIGWTEMLVVAIVAIIFVGPKDLPGMLRTFGKTARKVRSMAGDFQRQFDDALKDAELDGVKDSINQVRNLDPTKQIKDKLNPLKSDLKDIEDDLNKPVEQDLSELFDEDLAPDGPEPVKVDVDAALERQRKFDEAAKASQSSGTSAVPGLGTAKDAGAVEKPMARKTTTKSKSARTPAKKKAAVRKTSVRSTGSARSVAKTAAEKKTVTASKAKPKKGPAEPATAAAKTKAPSRSKAPAKPKASARGRASTKPRSSATRKAKA